MPHVYLATLGERPQAITVAYDILDARYHFAHVVIIHTDPDHSKIAGALDQVKQAFPREFNGKRPHYQEITRQSGDPLYDIQDQETARDYWRGMTNLLLQYQKDYTLHLMIAGGRKAMSIYATLAASLFFRPRDQVWTVLSPDSMLSGGHWRAPAGMRNKVQVVPLPVFPPERSAALQEFMGDLEGLLAARDNSREEFLAQLTRAERSLIDLLLQHRQETNKRLAAMLHKTEKTVEIQFASIYHKLGAYVEMPAGTRYRRQALLDFLDDRKR